MWLAACAEGAKLAGLSVTSDHGCACALGAKVLGLPVIVLQVSCATRAIAALSQPSARCPSPSLSGTFVAPGVAVTPWTPLMLAIAQAPSLPTSSSPSPGTAGSTGTPCRATTRGAG